MSLRPPAIRLVTTADLPALQEIERAAGECFREIGMPEIADEEPFALDVLDRYRRAGRAWVAVDHADRAVAYLLGDPIDGALHVGQVSVHPAHARHGIGRALLDELGTVAPLTLTTFADVPWNAPYYARLGFRVLDESEWTPGLRAIRDHEAAIGLDRWPRVCMRRDPAVR